MRILEQLSRKVGREEHYRNEERSLLRICKLTGVICADDEIMIQSLELFELREVFRRVESLSKCSEVACWTDLDRDILIDDLLYLLWCQMDAVAEAICIKINHGLRLAHLLLNFSAMQRKL